MTDQRPATRPGIPAGPDLARLGRGPGQAQSGAAPSGVGQHTQLLAPIEGPEQIANGPEVHPAFQPEKPTVLRRLTRWGPLVLLLVCATTLVVAAGSGGGRGEASANVTSDVDRAQHERRVRLPAVQATVGLTDDNKEAVLALCWRISGNPNTECRLSWLTDRGEFPATEAPMPAMDVDVFEVSNARYEACVAAGDCVARQRSDCKVYTMRGYALGEDAGDDWFAPDAPAVCVTHAEAQQFCEASGGRLPSDHEWERVARGGDDRLQPWGQFWSPGLLNWGERDLAAFPIAGRLDGSQNTAPVTSYEDGATPEGVQQTFGNAAEWVTATDGSTGVRGGDYTSDLSTLRATWHTELDAAERRTTVGFRCIYPR